MSKHLVKPLKAGRPRGTSRFDPDSAEAFGAVVRKHRVLIGISQEAVAELIDTDRSYLGRIERGEATPSLTMILLIAQALEIPASQLIDDTVKLLNKIKKESKKKK